MLCCYPGQPMQQHRRSGAEAGRWATAAPGHRPLHAGVHSARRSGLISCAFASCPRKTRTASKIPTAAFILSVRVSTRGRHPKTFGSTLLKVESRPKFAKDHISGLRSDRGPVVLCDFSKLRLRKSSYDFLNLYGRLCPYNHHTTPGMTHRPQKCVPKCLRNTKKIDVSR